MVSVKQQLLVCLLFGSTIVFGVDMPSDKKVDVNSSSNVIEKKVASQPVQHKKL